VLQVGWNAAVAGKCLDSVFWAELGEKCRGVEIVKRMNVDLVRAPTVKGAPGSDQMASSCSSSDLRLKNGSEAWSKTSLAIKYKPIAYQPIRLELNRLELHSFLTIIWLIRSLSSS